MWGRGGSFGSLPRYPASLPHDSPSFCNPQHQVELLLSIVGLLLFFWLFDHGVHPRGGEHAGSTAAGVRPKKKLVPNVRDLLPGPRPEDRGAENGPSPTPTKRKGKRPRRGKTAAGGAGGRAEGAEAEDRVPAAVGVEPGKGERRKVAAKQE